jgi:oxalate decarboxylase/phosphoglucose isomerase-like protein (cupin superfamily)
MPDLFIRPETVPAFGFDWGRLTLTVGPEVNGAARFSGGLVDVAPGSGHARHNHPGAEEIILVIEGTGQQMVEDEHGTPMLRDVGPGCTIFVPESRFHATLNTGDRPMKLFVVYSPAGPERALRDLPDFRLVPPGG